MNTYEPGQKVKVLKTGWYDELEVGEIVTVLHVYHREDGSCDRLAVAFRNGGHGVLFPQEVRPA